MKGRKPIEGVFSLLPTSFDAKGELDIAAIKENVSYLDSAGMHGVVIASGQGEFYTLNDDEFRKLVSAARESCKDMALVVNCSYQNTRTTLDRLKYAESVGADCAMIYPYHYMQAFSPKLYHKYFRLMNEATSNIQFMLFNNPREAKGCAISLDLYAQLLKDFPRIVATVEYVSTTREFNIRYVTAVYSHFGKRISILEGHEGGLYPSFSFGGKGCLATYGLAIPKFLLKFYNDCTGGRWDDALKDHWALTRYPFEQNTVGMSFTGYASDLAPGTFTTLLSYGDDIAHRKAGVIFPGTPMSCKAMAQAAGRKVGEPRLPMLPITEGMKKFAKGWLADIEDGCNRH